jgi:hypothetical protein
MTAKEIKRGARRNFTEGKKQGKGIGTADVLAG